MKPILDVCCGSKMFYFDKSDPNVVFMDCRALEDIDWNNCECDADNPIVYCCYKEGTEDE